MKEYINKYKHFLLLMYFPVYLLGFYYLETVMPDKIHIIECSLDKYIPFVEFFIVPYLLWFVYIGAAGVYFFLYEKESFCQLMYFGMIGMTLFLLVSYLYPNGLELRPENFARDNIFVELTKWIYRMDTPTNVLPSIHVFNSVGVAIAIRRSEKLKNKKWLQNASALLMVLIILSTMFLRQHSVIDVLTALALSCMAYDLVYNERWLEIRYGLETWKYRKKTVPEGLGK